MSLHHNPRIVTSGLVLALDAADTNSYPGSGTTWYDLSGTINGATLVNGPLYTSRSKGGIVLDGTNDHISIGTTPALDITSQLTLEILVRNEALADASHGDGLLSKGISDDNNSGVYEMLMVTSGGANYPFIRIRTNSTVTYNPTEIALELNKDYHIVGTYNGSIMRMFINGVEAGSGQAHTGAIELDTGRGLTLGVRYLQSGGDGSSQLDGTIYSARIYNRALSDDEVLQNYQAQKTRFQ